MSQPVLQGTPAPPPLFFLRVKNEFGAWVELYESTLKQAEFHWRTEPNVVYIGSRGTGKSLALRMEAHMRALQTPNFRYAILGLSYPDLVKNHLSFIDDEMRLLGGTYHKTDKIAYYPNGSKGFYSHADDKDGLGTMLGAEVYWLGVDELCSLEWGTFRKVAASVRVPKKLGLTAMVRAATNPTGQSLDRVYQYFIDKNVEDDPGYVPAEWHAVHTRLRNEDGTEDNSHIDVDQYIKNLGGGGLPPSILKAWLYGERSVEDAYFVITPDHFVDEPPRLFASTDAYGFVTPAPHIYRAVDWGSSDSTVCLWIAVYSNGRAVVFNEYSTKHTTAQMAAKEILSMSDKMRVIDTFCDPSMFAPKDSGLLGAGDVFANHRLYMSGAKNDRTLAGFVIGERLNTILPDGLPALQIYRPLCPMLTKTLPIMRVDPRHPGRLADGPDHWTIALSYFCMNDTPIPRAGKGPGGYVPVAERDIYSPGSNRHVLGSESVRRR